MKDLQDASQNILKIIEEVDWHQTMSDPAVTIKMIEAKAKLIEARKKLLDVIKICCEN